METNLNKRKNSKNTRKSVVGCIRTNPTTWPPPLFQDPIWRHVQGSGREARICSDRYPTTPCTEFRFRLHLAISQSSEGVMQNPENLSHTSGNTFFIFIFKKKYFHTFEKFWIENRMMVIEWYKMSRERRFLISAGYFVFRKYSGGLWNNKHQKWTI